jgi:hypothetical protein
MKGFPPVEPTLQVMAGKKLHDYTENTIGRPITLGTLYKKSKLELLAERQPGQFWNYPPLKINNTITNIAGGTVSVLPPACMRMCCYL